MIVRLQVSTLFASNVNFQNDACHLSVSPLAIMMILKALNTRPDAGTSLISFAVGGQPPIEILNYAIHESSGLHSAQPVMLIMLHGLKVMEGRAQPPATTPMPSLTKDFAGLRHSL